MTPRPLAACALALLAACTQGRPAGDSRPPDDLSTLPGHGGVPVDSAPKEEPRLLPAEAYIRSYLMLFGGLSPLDAQKALRAADGSELFDAWTDYLGSLGLPDYRAELPRSPQTHALMVATFERMGVALCDRALEKDLKAVPLPAVDKRTIFAFDLTAAAPTAEQFAQRFDVLHRTFLGYPAALAPTDRTSRFFQLYSDTVAKHAAPGAPASRFKPAEAGWAVVCYGLVRHPEFHLY